MQLIEVGAHRRHADRCGQPARLQRASGSGANPPRVICSGLLGLWLAGCWGAPPAELPLLETEPLASLPLPTTNNAVASVTVPAGAFMFTFMGLGAGKGIHDVHARAHVSGPGMDGWVSLPDVPGEGGRLAAAAATVRGRIHVFGGYTVAQDGAERSTPQVWALDVGSGAYVERAAMPVPVDDTVALVYRDRYVYLISGWHDAANVDDVQVYDAIGDVWQSATRWPGTPVFGHAGGIVGDQLVVCDGVKASVSANGARKFSRSDECWVGTIGTDDITQIEWRPLAPHPGAPRYRIAGTGDAVSRRYVFAGGSEIPYNYDGIGYDGRPAEPADVVLTLDAGTLEWREAGRLDVATMDHRALVQDGDRLVIIGGMRAARRVTSDVIAFRLPALVH
jgi:N-acetylneuraminic acid mutarotase